MAVVIRSTTEVPFANMLIPPNLKKRKNNKNRNESVSSQAVFKRRGSCRAKFRRRLGRSLALPISRYALALAH